MRTLPALAALAALATSTLAIAPAAACGPPPLPRVLRSTQHGVLADGHRWTRRAFVAIEGEVPADVTWRALAPGTFDNTHIAAAPALDHPLVITLVGPTGARVVETDRRVYLKLRTVTATPIVAVEVDDGPGFAIALAGRPRDVAWHALDATAAADRERAIGWLEGRGVVGANDVAVRRVAGDDLDIVTFVADHRVQFRLRRGTTELGAHAGSVLGALDANGERALVLADLSTLSI